VENNCGGPFEPPLPAVPRNMGRDHPGLRLSKHHHHERYERFLPGVPGRGSSEKERVSGSKSGECRDL